jgi:hypothetical protein
MLLCEKGTKNDGCVPGAESRCPDGKGKASFYFQKKLQVVKVKWQAQAGIDL